MLAYPPKRARSPFNKQMSSVLWEKGVIEQTRTPTICLFSNYNLLSDYQRTSANFKRRCGIGGVRIATYANRSTMVCNSNLLLNR